MKALSIKRNFLFGLMYGLVIIEMFDIVFQTEGK